MSPDRSPPASRNYPLLLVGQFLGAFGDNFLLKAILGPLTYAMTSGRITEAQVNGENALFSLVFSIPFIVLAPLAGFLNDRLPKTAWLVGGNLVKMAGASIGLAGVWAFPGASSHTVQVMGYAIVGVGACVYSPAKYGILPEVVATERLVKANGTVEMLTLVAIVSGLGLGGILYDRTLSLPACYGAGLALYVVAFACNAAMTRTPQNRGARLSRSAGSEGSGRRGSRRDRAGDDRHQGEHLNRAVCLDEPLRRNDLGQDPVLRGRIHARPHPDDRVAHHLDRVA